MCLCISMETTPMHDSGPGAVKQNRTSFHCILHTTHYTLHTLWLEASFSRQMKANFHSWSPDPDTSHCEEFQTQKH